MKLFVGLSSNVSSKFEWLSPFRVEDSGEGYRVEEVHANYHLETVFTDLLTFKPYSYDMRGTWEGDPEESFKISFISVNFSVLVGLFQTGSALQTTFVWLSNRINFLRK
jgi:hypothetical protein